MAKKKKITGETSFEPEESEFRKLEDGLWYIRMPLSELIRRQKEPIDIPSPAPPPRTSSDPSGIPSKKGRNV